MHRKNFSHFLSARKTPCLTQSLNSKKTSLIVVGLHVEDSNGDAITHPHELYSGFISFKVEWPNVNSA